MRLVCVGLVLAFGCGSHASSSGDDVPGDSGGSSDAGDPCSADPAACPSDSGTFVSAASGADTNPGTKTMPLKTISAGIAHAKSLGGAQPVYVAQGMYAEKVTLAEGIALNGGYECNATACSWTRDLAQFETTIVNQDFEGVLAGSAITPATLIGGFTIVGKDGVPPLAPGSAGVTVTGGSPTIRGNKIRSGTVTGGGASAADRSVGIAVRGTGTMAVVIENNDVLAAPAVGQSTALSLDSVGGTTSLAVVDSNLLHSGFARRSIGISAFGARMGTSIVNNDVIAGSSQAGASIGIEVTSRLVIDRNRINAIPSLVGGCTQQTQWCAGIASLSATVSITNNVIYGPSGSRTAGVFLTEAEMPAGQVVLNANWIGGGGSGGSPGSTSRPESAAVVISIGQCNNCGFNGFVGRIRNNILDGGNNLNRYGVREDPAGGRTSRVEVLDNNDITFQPMANRTDVLYHQVGQGGFVNDITSLFQLNGGQNPPAHNNLAQDPMVDSTHHLQAGSPCINKGVTTEAPQVDFDGDPRPAQGAMDIGADERPQ
jgi:hypothetical protein